METDPTSRVAKELLSHVHLIADFRYPTIQQTSIDYILEELLRAPRVTRDCPVSWHFLDAPPDGTVFLAYQPASRSSFSSDGYYWASPEQIFRQEINGAARPELNGFIMEMYIALNGYNPQRESLQGPAMHSRRRYRLLPNPANESRSGNPTFWIVHYHHAAGPPYPPASSVPIGPQEQQTHATRQYLQRYGHLQERKFMLQDQANWPSVVIPGQPLHSARGPLITFTGPHPLQGGRSHLQQGYATEAGPSPKRARHNNANAQRAAAARGPAVPPSAIEDDKDDPEESDRRDLFDILTQRDISQYRFEQHAEWMEEIYSDYSTFDIQAVSLGLGRVGFMKPLTDGFFDPPRPPKPPPSQRDHRQERPARRSPTSVEKAAENQKYDSDIVQPLGPGQAEEFFERVKKRLADNEREIKEMERIHEETIATMLQGSEYRKAAEHLRSVVSTDEGVSSEAAKIDGSRTAIHNPANGDATIASLRQIERIGKITQSVEELAGKKIKAVQDVKMIAKGGLVEKAPAKSKTTSMNTGDQMLFDDFLEPGASSGQQSNKPSASPQPFPNTAQSSVPQSNGPDDWVMVNKQDTQPTASADLNNTAAAPTTAQSDSNQAEATVNATNDTDMNEASLEAGSVDFGAEDDGDDGFEGGDFGDEIDFGELNTAGEAMQGFGDMDDGINMSDNAALGGIRRHDSQTSTGGAQDHSLPQDGAQTSAQLQSGGRVGGTDGSEDDAMDVLEDSAFGDAFHVTEAEHGEGDTHF